jgi:hypothetical protein
MLLKLIHESYKEKKKKKALLGLPARVAASTPLHSKT